MTPEQLVKNFKRRDDDAIREFNYSGGSESHRLAFLEGRVKDLCFFCFELCDMVEKLQNEVAARAAMGESDE